MIEHKLIGVVIPAYNESGNIGQVIKTIPSFVDKIIVINDASTDKTLSIVRKIAKRNRKIIIVNHKINAGVGSAIISGYETALKHNIFATAVMAGDGQMNPNELKDLVLPIVTDKADYTKGNRYLFGDAWTRIPKIRYLGNAALSMLTKIASGYWWLADSQTGYTVISLWALQHINLGKLYHNYGFPNDMLVKLNVIDARIAETPIEPIYEHSKKSKMKILKVIPRLSWLLITLFVWRLKEKYIIRNFHPLLFFYLLGVFLMIISVPLFIRIIWIWVTIGEIPPINTTIYIFCVITGIQTLMFAMWFDMEYNKHLHVKRGGR